MNQFILDESKKIREQSLWRSLAILENSNACEMLLNGKKYINFSSNDYLGYATDLRVIQASQAALAKYGSGGKSSRLISGSLDLHLELEEKLAKFKGTESALIFPTGFSANLGVISALLGEGDAVVMDRLNHASLFDAAKLSRCRLFVYEHGSIPSLERLLLRTKTYRKRMVVTDSLFSMDGDRAPLKEIVEICNKNKVWLMIDDAHATGVFGKTGRGLLETFDLIGKVEIIMGTLSKALGSQGGFVAGSKDLIQFLVNRARPFIYTTALSPASSAAALEALSLIEAEPNKRIRLHKRSQQLKAGILKKFLSNSVVEKSKSQIVPLMLGSAENTLIVANRLKQNGIYAPAIRPPTVPKNECRLRFSVTSEHSEKQIETLLTLL